MLYDLSSNLLLSNLAKSIRTDDPPRFEEQVALAADLLGVGDSTYTGSDLAKIERALALQLNHQIQIQEKHPELFFAKSIASTQTKQGMTYRDVEGLRLPFAVALVASVVNDAAWLDCKSVRRSFR